MRLRMKELKTSYIYIIPSNTNNNICLTKHVHVVSNKCCIRNM